MGPKESLYCEQLQRSEDSLEIHPGEANICNQIFPPNVIYSMKWSFTTFALGLVILFCTLISTHDGEDATLFDMSFSVPQNSYAPPEERFDIEGGDPEILMKYYTVHGKIPWSSLSEIVVNTRHHVKLLKLDPKQGHILNDVTDTESDDDTSGHDDVEQHNSDTNGALVNEESALKVVLLTYFRGGSTFLGEIFNQNPDVFYWFEPLAAPLANYKKTSNTKDYLLDDSGHVLSRPDDFVEDLLEINQQILDCEMEDLDRSVMKHYFAVNWRKSAKFRKYQSCMQRYKVRHYGNVTDEAVTSCQQYLENNCRRSSVRVIKTIRLFTEESVSLLRYSPNVKLVYYIRDPRGILLSRFSLGRRPLSDIPLVKVDQMAAFVCAKMRTDLYIARRIRDIRPGGIILLRYEDLALSPVDTVQQLHAFLNLELPEKVVNWVMKNTHARESDGSLGTRRGNSTEVATRWHTELPPSHQRIIELHCGDVIDHMYSMTFGYDRHNQYNV